MSKTEKDHTKLETTTDILSYAYSIAIWEASKAGVLTHEQLVAISKRADELLRALLRGDVLEAEGDKYAIRPWSQREDEDTGLLKIGE